MIPRNSSPPHGERGVILIYALIVLLILTIGGVALVRSMNSSLITAGNLAFRRDLVNQGEQAVANVLQAIQTGTISDTTADLASANYSSTMLDTNGQGVPNVLFSPDATFQATWTAPDVTGATNDVQIRYIIDRLCNATGPSSSTNCVQYVGAPKGRELKGGGVITPPSATVYRVSVRVTQTGRSTQVFLQTTFTKPN
jgi:Tfp pilus assembly protein PilX